MQKEKAQTLQQNQSVRVHYSNLLNIVVEQYLSNSLRLK